MESALNRLRSYIEDICRDKKTLIKILTVILILMVALDVKSAGRGEDEIIIEDTYESHVSADVCVDIGGAVVRPGVYCVTPETRVYEVIDLAGGLTENADTDSINRAAYVEDGTKIIVPEKRDTDDEASGSASGITSDGLVNINTASKDELKTLNGIGDVIADRIIEFRSQKRFSRIEDIKSVTGIGDAIFNKIKDSIRV